MTVHAPAFPLGINYWPARSAMGWWSAFLPSEVAADFERISAAGFDCIRLFLTWEDFQPTPGRANRAAVDRLLETMRLAADRGLRVMPTLFTGHMSGVNWIPGWALGGDAGDPRFRVVSAGAASSAPLRNWYSDDIVREAQARLAGELASALAGHAALWAWDLGNENSNCVIPPSTAHARTWLRTMSDAIRGADARALVTIGLHMEDLEQDRRLGPAEAAEVCDFLTMHGYPGYAPWASGATDEHLLAFLGRVTRWLGGGAEVVFSEFGVPTHREGIDAERAKAESQTALVSEAVAAAYIERALQALLSSGCAGALLWCHADYDREIWQQPPLDRAIHERSFGIWRADGSAKPAAAVVARFSEARTERPTQARIADDSDWIDIEKSEFYRPGGSQLPRLYERYRAARVNGGAR